MVLVSNEWQNKSEDEQKSSTAVVATSATPTTTGATQPPITTAAAAAATTTVAVAITSTISPATATIVNTDSATATIETIASDSKPPPTIAATSPLPAVTAASIITPATIRTIANDNNKVNNEQQQKDRITTEKIICNNNKINDNNDERKETSKTTITYSPANNLKEEDFISSVLNSCNIKIMAENTKEAPLKEEKETTAKATVPTTDAAESTPLISQPTGGESIKDLNESNSYPNSNTNTLQPSVTVKTQSTQNTKPTQQQQQPQQQQSLGCVSLTQQDFSSALHSALNATAAAGLQPSFLSQFALPANVSGLQKTAKQLNTSFAMTAAGATGVSAGPDTTHTKNDSNLSDVSNNSIAAITTSNLATVVPSSDTNNGQATIVLICEGNSHPFQARTISLTPNVECMVGRLIAKSKAAENNAIFDCKVLSRKHAVIWYSPDGKFWVKDTKSSNGTFINDNKLGDEEAELHFGDIVKFGVDVVENSRKEVHGCIIACVKLYLPDGRESISIDSPAHRSPYSGEGRISYDDLHRLNLYIQETAQREKVLASKLCSIQNILDATRKNSALCWQSMITEDQLLHRIHSLEKKLSFMEKNVPENVLRNEVLKLLDDKNSYQHTAKEALRKVYQERCDAMQMLAKMESAYTQSDNECALLRDQIMNSKQTLQDVNTRLLHLETEYNEYRDEVARQQQEAKEREEQRIAELTEKLRERELECEELKKKISELLIKRADLLDDEEKILEKQAIEKLDAAIADMDLGEDDDDDDADNDEDNDDNEAVDVEGENKKNGNAASGNTSSEANFEGNGAVKIGNDQNDASPSTETKKQANLTAPLTLTSIFGDNINGKETEDKTKVKSPKMSKHKKAKMLASLNQTKTSPPKRVKESTIMKWLQNSDLNKNEGSLDIFKAICNENEDEYANSSDEEDNHDEDSYKMKFTDVKLDPDHQSIQFTEKCTNFTSKLRNVEQNLKQLEAEIENRVKPEANCYDASDSGKDHKQKERSAKRKDVYNFDDNSDEEEEDDDEEGQSGASAEEGEEFKLIIKRNGKDSTSASDKVLSTSNKKYQLLKTSVNMLREAYNEIRDSVRDQDEARYSQESLSPPPLVKLQDGQLPVPTITSPNIAKSRLLETPESSRTSCDDLDTDSISEVESLSLNSPVNSSHSTIKHEIVTPAANQLLEDQLKEYQQQVGKLNEKLQQTELEAHHTLEIMQVECDDVKQKMLSLNKVIDGLKEDKKALEQVINENKHNKQQKEDAYCDVIEAELGVDNDLADINVTALEREEELITYKERLEEQQKENIELRNEIATLKLKAGRSAAVVATTTDVLLKRFLPYGFVVLAIIVYFISTYF